MKKALLFTVLVIIIYFAFFNKRNVNLEKEHNSPVKNEAQDEDIEKITINIDGKEMYVVSYNIKDSDEVIYKDNLNTKSPSKQVYEDEKCDLLTSAGFYSKEDKPIGLLIIDGKKVNNPVNSSLFNGFLYYSNGNFEVTNLAKYADYSFALQSGPLYFLDGKQVAKTENDVVARRVIFVDFYDSDPIIMTIYLANSYFSGPTIKQVNEILEIFQENQGKRIKSAVNLDGGTASAFLSKNFKLTEATSVGAFLCVRNMN